MTQPTDIIDLLAGLSAGSSLRALREEARRYSQKSHDVLLGTPAEGMMPLDERLAVAFFVAGLHRDAPATAHYRMRLAASGLASQVPALEAAVAAGLAEGPYGDFPAGPLSAENAAGPRLVSDRAALGTRLAAAIDHAHLLVLHPRDAGRADMLALAAAGWSATDIVTLSQLISFLCFQIRAAAGLRVLAATN